MTDGGPPPGPPPGLTIRPLSSHAELRRCVELQAEVWGPDFADVVPPPILMLAQRLGGILSGAFDESGEMVGFVFGLTGISGGRVVHWSDMLGVRAATRDRGIGDALKRHQRDLLLLQDVRHVQWSFEPLESRNAHVNFTHLGVTVREYVRDFYGSSISPLHGEIGTDRIIAEWDVGSDRVSTRLSGAARPPRPEDVRTVPVINPHRTAAGLPRCDDANLALDAARLLLTVPSDIQTLKRVDPALARAWRAITCAAFERYLGLGYTAVEFVRGEDVGNYLLARAGTTA